MKDKFSFKDNLVNLRNRQRSYIKMHARAHDKYKKEDIALALYEIAVAIKYTRSVLHV